MNPLIDCHTHIHQHESIEHKEIINRSLSANVKIIVCAGTSIEDSIHSISLSDKSALFVSSKRTGVFEELLGNNWVAFIITKKLFRRYNIPYILTSDIINII